MRLRYLGFIAFLLSTSAAFGDGCYVPQRAVRKIPEIVAQRAVLSWKDGAETLVISSALNSEAQKLGWIIPVPAVPTTIEKATPGALKTLDFCIQPKITHDLSREVRATIIAVLLANLLWGTWLFNRKRFGSLLLLLLLLFVCSGLLLPALGTAGAVAATRTSSVKVEKTATVGSYTTSILRPTRPDGLDGWLVENGFAALPESAGPIIADYISQGWVFAAIKLTRGESGVNSPHPIKLVFASKEAVYPMKLTSIAGGKPGFELFVIGDDRATCDTLEEKFCDCFSKTKNDEWGKPEPLSRFDGTTTRCNIGHSAIGSLMWDNCVLTKLVGSVDSAGMTKDIQFTWKPFKSHQDHYFTQAGAGYVAVILFVFAVGGWNVLCMKDYAKGLIQPGLIRYIVRRLLLGVACAAVVSGICFALLPKLATSDVQIPWGWRHAEYLLGNTFEERLKNQPEVLARSESEIADFLLRSLHDTVTNETLIGNGIAGGEVKMEDSPGNFTIEKQADKVIIRVYDRFGTAVVRTLPIQATGNPGQPDPAPACGAVSRISLANPVVHLAAMKREFPPAEDDSDRKLLANVQRVGWHVVGIHEDEKGPAYAFSVGLFYTFEHPEIIIFGLSHETAGRMINIIGSQVQGGKRFAANEQSNDVAEGFPVAFKMVPKDFYREYIGYALWFYRSLDFPVLQCVWPDNNGLFAWQDGYAHRFDQLQPILAHPSS